MKVNLRMVIVMDMVKCEMKLEILMLGNLKKIRDRVMENLHGSQVTHSREC